MPGAFSSADQRAQVPERGSVPGDAGIEAAGFTKVPEKAKTRKQIGFWPGGPVPAFWQRRYYD